MKICLYFSLNKGFFFINFHNRNLNKNMLWLCFHLGCLALNNRHWRPYLFVFWCIIEHKVGHSAAFSRLCISQFGCWCERCSQVGNLWHERSTFLTCECSESTASICLMLLFECGNYFVWICVVSFPFGILEHIKHHRWLHWFSLLVFTSHIQVCSHYFYFSF